MSLTNPNKIVTEERLSEFYGQILPYMGGMPDVLANKFSKGDLYSTDEKMIGCWTDGKPVYQKTYIVSSVTSSNKLIDSTMKLSDITLVGFISNGIQMGGNYNGTTFVGSITASCSLRVWNDTNGLYCNLENANITATQARFTVQYTKTTDSPVSIGSDTDYSTEEKIIGTWLDGKPIYQKTWTNTEFDAKKDAWTNTDITIENVAQLVSVKAYNIDSSPNSCINLSYRMNGNMIQYYSVGTIWVGINICTVQYTKTTD